jgi:4-diphosphocytidyl-2-C-methyl-D-erythritol kinase
MRSPSSPLQIKAFAKINLSLKVSAKRSDGYHDIDSIMQSISLHDIVEIKPSSSGFKVKCSIDIPNNIAAKTAELMFGEISIKKNIPLAAGLAGGSADAAAVIFGINSLYGLNLHFHRLMEIAAKVGSDVPFCLIGGTARCTGRGEKIEKVGPSSGDAFILVVPDISVTTKLVYEEFDKGLPVFAGNDLEGPAIRLFPGIKAEKEKLNGLTGKIWRMSGSGPSLFMELDNVSESERFTEVLSKNQIRFHVVVRVPQGVEQYVPA